ncbi:uncharacterized protein HD556DRAFT_1312101 [Suillus plorans]|uniref:DUF6532 domain-containing protein n=1 Tax=Suillus plorans TaxID=116603 RepID=A0A9P7AFI2_9AGAM|nr:uncharacterized protein HD556DRAFT_1312101 [Suillus plorans]KAG1788338.1 hypothetical protein HD556DRAFT_1312101 [Suillus plorans]
MSSRGHKKKVQGGPVPTNRGDIDNQATDLQQNFNIPEQYDAGDTRNMRVRRNTTKKQAQEDTSNEKQARKINRYVHQALRNRQALEEINGFQPLDSESRLDPESEQEDSDLEQDVFTFRAVQPSATHKPMPTLPPVPPTLPPRLTQRTTHIPSAPVRRVQPSDNVIDPALLRHVRPSDDMIDPTLLPDHGSQDHVYSQLATPQQNGQPYVPPTDHLRVGHDTEWPGEYADMSSPSESLSRRLVNSGRGHSSTRELLMYSRAESESPALQHPRVHALTPSRQPLLATAGIKRAGHPALTTIEGLQLVKKVKMGEGGTWGRVRSADFDKLYASTIHLAVGHYQSILANTTIYPNDIEARDWSGQAWAAACRSQGVRIDYDEDAYKLITERGSNLRSDLKTALRALVETEFGFKNDKTPEAIRFNAELTSTLLGNRKLFTCKNREAGKGLFEADIILKGITKWCYDRKNSLGATLSSYFKDTTTGGASLGIIAAVLTGIEACVVEWTTGTKIESRFYKERYAAIFETYYKMLVDFDEGTRHADILPKICKRLLKHARRHANVPEDAVRVGGTSENFSTDEFAAAAAEWDGRVESDDEY